VSAGGPPAEARIRGGRRRKVADAETANGNRSRQVMDNRSMEGMLWKAACSHPAPGFH
jgi:hypothetical protein